MRSYSLTWKKATVFAVLLSAAVVLSGAPAPAGFPSDIPLYKDSKLISSGAYMDDPKLGKQFVFETPDSVETVRGFYKQQLPANGWTITKPAYVANPNTISIQKGNRAAMVSPNRFNDTRTRIQFVIMATN